MHVSRISSLLALVGLGLAWIAPAGCSSASKVSGFEAVDSGADVALEAAPMLNEGPDARGGVSLDGGGVLNDGAPMVDGQSCLPDAGGPGPVQRICIHAGADKNECDGLHDLIGFPLNGTKGNGFDDNCNGLVDEGCACDAPGLTKDCFLVPASQTYGGKAVGWCAQNSKGSVDCVKPTEQPGTWSGQCRGAQPPYADDICANGDFNCDGKDQNAKTQDCSCKAGTVQCPTDPLQTVPYPPPNALPLKVDATTWFLNPAVASMATNWKWTLSGGDCDNILPHPTFAMYPTDNATAAGLGTQVDTLGVSGKEHGQVAKSPQVTSSFYPAFSLSGDYLLQGEFDLFGEHVSCQQKIQVRAPGIRAEACWDTENSDSSNHADIDLHMAKVNAFPGCAKKGWVNTCAAEDCFYANCKGTSSGNPNWYPASAASACVGWGSAATGSCGNPRLDRDLITCDRTNTNPNAVGSSGQFCGPENINVDAPKDQDKFAVGLRYFGGSPATRAHVNVYCNGERVLSTGYNPVTGNDFPRLLAAGGDSTGDMWKVAMITATVNGNGLSCDVKPVPSQLPHPATDGSNAYCVDNTGSDSADSAKYFAPGGAAPLDAPALCFH